MNEFTLTARLEILPLELGKTDRYMLQAYVHVSSQVFHFSPLNLNFYSKFFSPLTKMFPSFKLLLDSLSCYSCGQKPSFLSLSEIHLEINNLTLIKLNMLDKS